SKEEGQEKVKRPATYVHVDVDENGMIVTNANGNTIFLLGLLDVARENLKQRLVPAAEVKQDT
ncbi:hypothetical protein KAR91_56660, partial [Candidatus Pacearchaeota archaeon]|nr:hypothetical protein [Candidatus Pacearchaeota archaeon]